MERHLRARGGFSACGSLKLTTYASKMTPIPTVTKLAIYSWSVILLGGAAVVYTVLRTSFNQLGLDFWIFGLVTVIFASRIMVPIPRIKGHISVSDTFIFLSILLFGGEAGIILSTVDAIPGSYKLAKTHTTYFFNIAV